MYSILSSKSKSTNMYCYNAICINDKGGIISISRRGVKGMIWDQKRGSTTKTTCKKMTRLVKFLASLTYTCRGSGNFGIVRHRIYFQGLRQDLETGCTKLSFVKSLDMLFFKGDHNILKVSTINMYLIFLNKA